ncbi:hypothetical protein O9992_18760 [Vibrio lentus]|nr:hypothetical protein [Vibrio lentus]
MVADATSCFTNNFVLAFSYENIITIKNGVDCNKFKPMSKIDARTALNLPQDKHIIGCAGRLEHVKGRKTNLSKPPHYCPKIWLSYLQEAVPNKKLTQLTNRLNLNDRVIFLGLVEDMTTFTALWILSAYLHVMKGYRFQP